MNWYRAACIIAQYLKMHIKYMNHTETISETYKTAISTVAFIRYHEGQRSLVVFMYPLV